ncbi:hypothetical protein HYT05_03490 [Candidatus Kaiserbacteria bacterium]|nr:hypothetical protein [Candidatus Kaiserbacteria bacterium]
MKWLRYFSYALAFVCAYLLFTSPRYQYSNAELVKLYGLEGKDSTRVANLLPPPPHRYPRWLARQSDPLMRKSVKDLTDREIDTIVFRTAERLHTFWTREFALRGGTYVPVEIIPEWGPSDPRTEGDHGTRFVDGKVYVDRREVREASGTWASADGSLIEAWVAHEIGHYVARVTGVRDAALERAIPDPGIYIVIAPKRLPGKPDHPIEVYIEQQAQYLAGVSLRDAGMLYEGYPEDIYYLCAASGDDFMRLNANWLTDPPDAEYFKDHADHGYGKDFAKAIYDGMLPSGDLDAGLRLLGTEPRFTH